MKYNKLKADINLQMEIKPPKDSASQCGSRVSSAVSSRAKAAAKKAVLLERAKFSQLKEKLQKMEEQHRKV